MACGCGGYVGLGEDTVLSVTWACLLCMGLLLLLGIFCRPVAIIAWFLHLCAAESGGLFAYGADDFMTTGTLLLDVVAITRPYTRLIVGCYKQAKGSTTFGLFGGGYYKVTSVFYLFFRRSGKMSRQRLVEWIQSMAIADSATFRSCFPGHSCSIQIRFAVLGISICLIEVGYPVFIWIKKTRFFWVVCILAMHTAIGLTMGLYLFALVMIVLNLAAFGVGMGKQRPVSARFYDGRKHRATSKRVRISPPAVLRLAVKFSRRESGHRESSYRRSVFLVFAGFRSWKLVRARNAGPAGGRGHRECLRAMPPAPSERR